MTFPLSCCLRRITACLPDVLRRDDGTASMEFVLVVPLLLMIFMAVFESGLLMTRSIMLEHSVDMTMRELRLGHIPKVTNLALKQDICARTVVFPGCMKNMKIELERVSTTTWVIPPTPAQCINRREAAEPVQDLNPGQQNDLMIVRVCMTVQAMFPTTGLALSLPHDKDGGYRLVVTSAFVVEPT